MYKMRTRKEPRGHEMLVSNVDVSAMSMGFAVCCILGMEFSLTSPPIGRWYDIMAVVAALHPLG